MRPAPMKRGRAVQLTPSRSHGRRYGRQQSRRYWISFGRTRIESML
jgi:hypothetical protein